MENFDKSKSSGAFIAYDEKFFVHRLWKTEPHKDLINALNNDKILTTQERNYFIEEYGV